MSDVHLSLSMHIKLHHLSNLCCLGTGHDEDVSVFIGDFNSIWWVHVHVVTLVPINEGLDGGSGILYSLKIKPIIHLIKILGYSLK